MLIEHKPNYYIGTITYIEKDPLEILDKDKLFHEVLVSVPGVFEYVKAWPSRNQLDEPKVGDLVIVCAWDPTFNSYCTYEKLRENDFLGFRAHGKMLQIDHDKITVGVFDEETEYKDEEAPDVHKLAHLEMDKEGHITVHALKDITINGDSNCNITIKGDVNLTVEGNVTEKVSGSVESRVEGNGEITISGTTKLTSPDVTITGGKINIKGQATPDMNGPFCALKNCVFSGAPQSGSMSTT